MNPATRISLQALNSVLGLPGLVAISVQRSLMAFRPKPRWAARIRPAAQECQPCKTRLPGRSPQP